MPNDGIDLGSKPAKEMSEAKISPAKEVYYPSINVRDAEGLDDLPEGEFTFTGKGKVVSYTESMRDGKESCSCEIEIHSIKPSTKKTKKTKDGGERLDESLDKIAKHKMNDVEDYADESDE